MPTLEKLPARSTLVMVSVLLSVLSGKIDYPLVLQSVFPLFSFIHYYAFIQVNFQKKYSKWFKFLYEGNSKLWITLFKFQYAFQCDIVVIRLHSIHIHDYNVKCYLTIEMKTSLTHLFLIECFLYCYSHCLKY